MSKIDFAEAYNETVNSCDFVIQRYCMLERSNKPGG